MNALAFTAWSRSYRPWWVAFFPCILIPKQGDHTNYHTGFCVVSKMKGTPWPWGFPATQTHWLFLLRYVLPTLPIAPKSSILHPVSPSKVWIKSLILAIFIYFVSDLSHSVERGRHLSFFSSDLINTVTQSNFEEERVLVLFWFVLVFGLFWLLLVVVVGFALFWLALPNPNSYVREAKVGTRGRNPGAGTQGQGPRGRSPGAGTQR